MSLDYAVVHVSPIDWAFRKQDQQFIATALAAQGHPVLYIENTGARIPTVADLPRVGDRIRNWARGRVQDTAPVPSGVEVLSPICIPGASLGIERAINATLLRFQMGRSLEHLGPRPRVLWIGLPTWTALDMADWLGHRLLVYYCGDALTDLPGLRRGIVASERALLQKADVVFAASSALVEHCRELGADPVEVPMSIDFEASRAAREGRVPAPSELRGLAGRLIGYMGGLNSKVDVELLEAVCERFPNDTLVVLGGVDDPRCRPRSAPNLVILGERPYGQIAGYLVRFDVCLIPYKLSQFTKAVNPGKLLEYLALGRPVVSTPLPEVLRFSKLVRVAGNREEFLAAIEDAFRTGNDRREQEERVRRAETHAYETVAASVIAVAERTLRSRVERGT